MSKTLPWRTAPMPATPSERSAPSIALPWGSSTPGFSVTTTRALRDTFVSLTGIASADMKTGAEAPA